MLTRIKICGITNRDDLQAACELGADALGFAFVPDTPRYIGADPDRACALLREVPPLVWRVGLYDTLPSNFGPPELHAIQYYHAPADGGRSDALASQRPLPVLIKAFRVRDENSLEEIARDNSPKQMVLLDAYAPGKLGGTGHTFNWELATRARQGRLPLVLAGGLTPENVAEAVRQVRPYMVDVSSGVEAAPGRKDHDKLRRFIQAVREVDIEQA